MLAFMLALVLASLVKVLPFVQTKCMNEQDSTEFARVACAYSLIKASVAGDNQAVTTPLFLHPVLIAHRASLPAQDLCLETETFGNILGSPCGKEN